MMCLFNKLMNKIAYLTIDDAPSKKMDEKLRFLLKKKIPAIWFCNGINLEKNPLPAINAIKNGYVIGNHGFDHYHFSKLSLDECYTQIMKADQVLKKIYDAAGVIDYPKIFRFPYGDREGSKEKWKAIQDFLRKLGYSRPSFTEIKYNYFHEELKQDVDWMWTYDTCDWSVYAEEPVFGINSLERVFERMEENVPEEGRGLNSDSVDIILVHDHEASHDLFPKIINKMIAKGIQLTNPNEFGRFSWIM